MEWPNRFHIVRDFRVDGWVRVSLRRGIRVEDNTKFHRAHAPNFDIGASGCAISYEKDDKRRKIERYNR